MKSVAERLAALDWEAVETSLFERGYARTPPVLSARECRELVALYGDDARFRSRVDMERYRFGRGDYAYFARPLPRLVQALRAQLYRRLAPIATRQARLLRRQADYPPALRAFLARCREAGQTRPTPLLLRYGPEGYNCLHRDLYGAVAFPLQVTAFLSERGSDYEGGEFLLLEQRARAQSRGEAIPAERGELVVFPTAERPAPGRHGPVRAEMRHGVSRVTRGSRYALGIIFHDAR